MSRDPRTLDLFIGSAELIRCPVTLGRAKHNPCVIWFGPGPAGACCQDCRHLVRHSGAGYRPWFKCDLRANRSGKATDHRAYWPACARFTAIEGTA